MPSIWQGFVEKPARVQPGIDFDRRLYVARRVFEQSSPETYVCSLSSRTIVYKGMFLVNELRLFYPTCRMPTMNPPSVWSTAGSPPTPPPAGTVLTPTA